MVASSRSSSSFSLQLPPKMKARCPSAAAQWANRFGGSCAVRTRSTRGAPSSKASTRQVSAVIKFSLSPPKKRIVCCLSAEHSDATAWPTRAQAVEVQLHVYVCKQSKASSSEQCSPCSPARPPCTSSRMRGNAAAACISRTWGTSPAHFGVVHVQPAASRRSSCKSPSRPSRSAPPKRKRARDSALQVSEWPLRACAACPFVESTREVTLGPSAWAI
mmetsp:Transcript_20659/g.47636  ORF Transcript_20659/g.47636 Transcript_20659/m.47636 type:complete len:218 (+) Transcript_20659:354-1007(+)